MKDEIKTFINKYVADYMGREDIATEWGQPLVGFADASDPYILSLPEIISPTHALPRDVMPRAKTVIAYFVPFTRALARENSLAGSRDEKGWPLASGSWARAYEETNKMFSELNAALIDFLQARGFQGLVPDQARTFDQKKLISDWSHRHLAYAAGLGTFGINNMLITRRGCCGRFNTVVTDLELEPDPPAPEMCIYKKNGGCGLCVKNCPTGALRLTLDGAEYDRVLCYALCRSNSQVHTGYGSSYDDGSGNANSVGSEVCGKCVTGSPCAFWKR